MTDRAITIVLLTACVFASAIITNAETPKTGGNPGHLMPTTHLGDSQITIVSRRHSQAGRLFLSPGLDDSILD